MADCATEGEGNLPRTRQGPKRNTKRSCVETSTLEKMVALDETHSHTNMRKKYVQYLVQASMVSRIALKTMPWFCAPCYVQLH
eukprot:1269556-Amphidinium_carterae.2